MESVKNRNDLFWHLRKYILIVRTCSITLCSKQINRLAYCKPTIIQLQSLSHNNRDVIDRLSVLWSVLNGF